VVASVAAGDSGPSAARSPAAGVLSPRPPAGWVVTRERRANGGLLTGQERLQEKALSGEAPQHGVDDVKEDHHERVALGLHFVAAAGRSLRGKTALQHPAHARLPIVLAEQLSQRAVMTLQCCSERSEAAVLPLRACVPSFMATGARSQSVVEL
jgi:hypothetical protein